MTSFFADFVHTDNGLTCSDSGFVDLSTAQECSGSIRYATSFNSKANYKFEVSWSHYPKGCFIWLDPYSVGSIYFNTHPTGERTQWSASICRKGNT